MQIFLKVGNFKPQTTKVEMFTGRKSKKYRPCIEKKINKLENRAIEIIQIEAEKVRKGGGK